MPKLITIKVGETYGKLTILCEVSPYIQPKSKRIVDRFLCKCVCGVECTKLKYYLTNSKSLKDCGCSRKAKEKPPRKLVRHNGTTLHKETYGSFSAMKSRCYQINNKEYSRYGGSGITVCDRWLEPVGKGFMNFLEDMGDKPQGKSLNRVNGAKVYSKETCEWATYGEQCFDQDRLHKSSTGVIGVTKGKYSWVSRLDRDKNMYNGKSFLVAYQERAKAELATYGKRLNYQHGTILLNCASCLSCGDILKSHHRHDFVSCSCGKIGVDGGREYIRRVGSLEHILELSIYSSVSHVVAREILERGSRGKDGDQPLTWIPLCEISDDYLVNLLDYQEKSGYTETIDYKFQKMEQQYRLDNNITVEEK